MRVFDFFSKLFAYIVFFLCFYLTLPAQVNQTFEVELTSVQVGKNSIPKQNWEGLKIQEDLPLTITFLTEGRRNNQVFYRVFVDGNLPKTIILSAT